MRNRKLFYGIIAFILPIIVFLSSFLIISSIRNDESPIALQAEGEGSNEYFEVNDDDNPTVLTLKQSTLNFTYQNIDWYDPGDAINHGSTNNTRPWGGTVDGEGQGSDHFFKEIKTIIVKKEVTHIGNYAFYGFTKLTNIIFEDNSTLQSIGNYAFFEASLITKLSFPDTLTTIGENAFEECTTLKEVTFGTKISTIGDECFNSCNQLTLMTFPYNDVENDNFSLTLGTNAFHFSSSKLTIYYKVDSTGSFLTGGSPTTVQNAGYVGEVVCTKMELIAPLFGTYVSGSTHSNNIAIDFGIYQDISDVSIYYTVTYFPVGTENLVGEDPTDQSTLYDPNNLNLTDVPIHESKIVLVKAIAYKTGWKTSDISSFIYTISNKESVAIPTLESSISTQSYCNSNITFLQISNDAPYYAVDDSNIWKEVGQHTITLCLKEPDKYKWSDESITDKTIEVEITKATVDLTNISFVSTEFEYTGQEQTLLLSNNGASLPAGILEVNYSNNKLTELGSQLATASFVVDPNYNDIEPLQATISIVPRRIDQPLITQLLEYNGEVQSFVNASNDYTIEYTQSGAAASPINAGEYTLTISLNDTTHTCWNISSNSASPMERQVNIAKASLSIEGLISYEQSQTKTYTGEPLTIDFVGAEDVNDKYSFLTVTTETQTNASATAYTIRFIYNIDPVYAVNYNVSSLPILSASLTIKPFEVDKPDADVTAFYYDGSNKTYNIDTNSEYYTVSGLLTKADVGQSDITISLKNKVNYVWKGVANDTDDIVYVFEIHKGRINDFVEFDEKIIEYDDEEHSLEIKTLPIGVNVAYTYHRTYPTLLDITTFPKEIGEYEVTATFTLQSGYDTKYETPVPVTSRLIITPTLIDRPAKDSTRFIYDGVEKVYNIASSQFYKIKGSQRQTNAGHYTIELEFNMVADKKYAWKPEDDSLPFSLQLLEYGTIRYDFIIEQAEYDMPELPTKIDLVYDGTNQYSKLSLGVTLPQGLQASFNDIGELIRVGQYQYTVSFTGNPNYKPIESYRINVFIHPKVIEIPAEDTTRYVYNGTEQRYNIKLSEEKYYEVYNTLKTDAGDSNVRIALSNPNYEWSDGTSEPKTYVFTIHKATYDMSGITFKDESIPFSGIAYYPQIKGTLPLGVTVSYDTEGYVKSGQYTITASFIGDKNYEDIPDMTAKLTIGVAVDNITSVTSDIKLIAPDGYGFADGARLVTSEMDYTADQYATWVPIGQKVTLVYSIQICDPQGYIVPDLAFETPITLVIKVPEGLEKTNFTIIHYHNAKTVSLITKGTNYGVGKYKIVDGYIYTEINNLSSFVFTTDIRNKAQDCIVHWFLLGLLILTTGFNIYWFIIKKHTELSLIPFVELFVHLLLLLILGFLAKCFICLIFGILNFIPIGLAITAIFLARYKVVKEKQENEKRLKEQRRIELDVDEIKQIEQIEETEEDYVYHIKKSKQLSKDLVPDEEDYIYHKVKKDKVDKPSKKDDDKSKEVKVSKAKENKPKEAKTSKSKEEKPKEAKKTSSKKEESKEKTPQKKKTSSKK